METGDALALTTAMVRIDSRNPGLVPGGPGEAECATLLAAVLRDWGFDVETTEAAPGRPNVVARLAPEGGGSRRRSRRRSRGRSLLLCGHLDVVGIDGMTHPAFEPDVRDGRVYGRGSADMKAGIAAMCAAAVRARAAGTLGGEVIVAAVADEEYESIGTRALLAAGLRADGAIVTEPTRLRVMPAHRGFAWYTVTVHGRAAHGSRYDMGVDAIRHAGLVLAELDEIDTVELPSRAWHPLLGRGSLHASFIDGGTGLTTYPDRCVVRIERRTLPGESAASALAEIGAACDRVGARRPTFRADLSIDFSQPPSDVSADAPLVRALVDALGAAGEAPTPLEGMSAWTDAALLNEAGIPAICFGPGDIALAHSPTEYVPIDEIERATRVLETLIARW